MEEESLSEEQMQEIAHEIARQTAKQVAIEEGPEPLIAAVRAAKLPAYETQRDKPLAELEARCLITDFEVEIFAVEFDPQQNLVHGMVFGDRERPYFARVPLLDLAKNGFWVEEDFAPTNLAAVCRSWETVASAMADE